MTPLNIRLAEALRTLLAATNQRPVLLAQVRDAEPEAIKALAAYDAQQRLIAAGGTAPDMPDIPRRGTQVTDTIQKIAGDMLALAELLHDPSPEKKRLRALAERLRALSARASAGEGGEWVLVERSDLEDFRAWASNVLAAAPQPQDK